MNYLLWSGFNPIKPLKSMESPEGVPLSLTTAQISVDPLLNLTASVLMVLDSCKVEGKKEKECRYVCQDEGNEILGLRLQTPERALVGDEAN